MDRTLADAHSSITRISVCKAAASGAVPLLQRDRSRNCTVSAALACASKRSQV